VQRSVQPLKCIRKCEEELKHRKINSLILSSIPVLHKSKKLEIDFRCNLFIEECLVVEIKAVQVKTNVFEAKLLTYVKLLKVPKGILINFNCSNIFKEGQKTYINEYFNLLYKA
jgi:GxxExxY protein